MADEKELRSEVEDLKAKCSEYLNTIVRKENEIAQLHQHLDELRMELAGLNSPRNLAKRLFGIMDARIMGALTRRGQRKQVVERRFIPLVIEGNPTYEQLIQIVQRYDSNEYFSLRAERQKNPLRLHYRIAAKAYRLSRDSGVVIAKKVARK